MSSRVVLKGVMLLLGVAGALLAAVAVTLFAMWILDRTPGSPVTRELGASVVLALLAAACLVGRAVVHRTYARAGYSRSE